VGGALGSLAGAAALALLPGAGIDPRMAALVGMAAMFAGASRAVLASAVFAFEVTQQTSALLPLIAGCGAAYLVSCLLMRNSIMTEKIVRRGVRVPSEYAGDVLDQVSAGKACSRKLVWLDGAQTVAAARAWLNSGRPEAEHQGFPVLDAAGHLIGVVTRKDVFRATDGQRRIGELIGRAPVVIAENHTLREAAERMVAEGIGRLIVVAAGRPGCVVGILTRADVLAGHAHRLREKRVAPGWWGARRTAEEQSGTAAPEAATQEG
jgi:CBS domain-containing protein